MRNGAYAGPVTEGNADDSSCNPPAERSRARAGSAPASIARASVSIRTPSARRTITDISFTCRLQGIRPLPASFAQDDSDCKLLRHAATQEAPAIERLEAAACGASPR